MAKYLIIGLIVIFVIVFFMKNKQLFTPSVAPSSGSSSGSSNSNPFVATTASPIVTSQAPTDQGVLNTILNTVKNIVTPSPVNSSPVYTNSNVPVTTTSVSQISQPLNPPSLIPVITAAPVSSTNKTVFSAPIVAPAISKPFTKPVLTVTKNMTLTNQKIGSQNPVQ